MKAIDAFKLEVDVLRDFGVHYASLGNATQQQSITGDLQTHEQLNDLFTQYTQCLPLAAILADSKLNSQFDDFAKQALYQHVCAYPNQLDLPNLWSEMVQAVKKGPRWL